MSTVIIMVSFALQIDAIASFRYIISSGCDFVVFASPFESATFSTRSILLILSRRCPFSSLCIMSSIYDIWLTSI